MVEGRVNKGGGRLPGRLARSARGGFGAGSLAASTATLVVLVAVAACAAPGGGGAADSSAATEVLILSPEGGGFHAFSFLLAEDLAARLGGEFHVRLLTETGDGDAISGSMDILDAMARRTEGPAHYLGLSQSDVAYHFRHGGHPMYEVPHVHRERLAVLAKTFPETLYLYSSVPPPADTGRRWEFDDYQARWRSLYLGEVGSGTLITAYNVFPVISSRPLGAPGPDLRQHRLFPPNAASAGVVDDEPFGAMLVSSHPRDRIDGLREREGGTLISLSSSQQRHLVSVYSAFYRAGREKGESEAGTSGDAAGLRLEIPALLVADRGLPEEVATAVFAFLAEMDRDASGLAARATAAADLPSALDGVDLTNLFAAMRVYRDERFSDLILPPHRSLVALPKANFVVPLLLAAVFLVALVVLLGSWLRSSRAGLHWLEMPRKLVFGAALALTLLWFHLCLAAVMVLERRAYVRYQVDSPSLFIERSYVDLVPGLIHYTASGFSVQELVPKDYASQLIWLSIPFVIALGVLGGSMHVAVPPIVRYLGKYIRGERPLPTTDHVVILYWHPYASQVIRQLTEHARLEGGEAPSFLVVCPDPAAVDLRSVAELNDDLVGPYTVHRTTAATGTAEQIDVAVLSGDPRSEDALVAAGLSRARLVFVFPAPAHPEPDSVSALILLRIQQLVPAGADASARPKVLVWAADPANVPLLMDERLGANDVCSMEWAWRVLCQSTYVDSVSNVYRRLMVDTVDTEELYELVLPEEWHPRTFAELLGRVWAYNAEKAETLAEIGKRNVVSLVGLAKREDPRKQDVELCPDPEQIVRQGDRLLLITYKFDRASRERLLGHLSLTA
jgi:hypothetical protein